MDIFEKFYRFDKADEVRAAGVYPYFHALESKQDTEVIMEGKRRIMLGSNNYLGLTTHPEVIAAAHAGMEVLGFSLVSNAAAGITGQTLSEQEVLDAAAEAKERFSRLISGCVERISVQ